MDSTNVNSERDNEVCAAAQIIPTQKEVEIPPKKAKTGPSILEVAQEPGIEIQANDCIMTKDGMLYASDGKTPIMKFSPESAKNIFDKKSKNKNEKGKDR